MSRLNIFEKFLENLEEIYEQTEQCITFYSSDCEAIKQIIKKQNYRMKKLNVSKSKQKIESNVKIKQNEELDLAKNIEEAILNAKLIREPSKTPIKIASKNSVNKAEGNVAKLKASPSDKYKKFSEKKSKVPKYKYDKLPKLTLSSSNSHFSHSKSLQTTYQTEFSSSKSYSKLKMKNSLSSNSEETENLISEFASIGFNEQPNCMENNFDSFLNINLKNSKLLIFKVSPEMLDTRKTILEYFQYFYFKSKSLSTAKKSKISFKQNFLNNLNGLTNERWRIYKENESTDLLFEFSDFLSVIKSNEGCTYNTELIRRYDILETLFNNLHLKDSDETRNMMLNNVQFPALPSINISLGIWNSRSVDIFRGLLDKICFRCSSIDNWKQIQEDIQIIQKLKLQLIIYDFISSEILPMLESNIEENPDLIYILKVSIALCDLSCSIPVLYRRN